MKKSVTKFMQEKRKECYVNKQTIFPKNMLVQEGAHAVTYTILNFKMD
jgi:hypothetical protein